MDWMLLPLRRYADFSGRSCRKEYWMFVLFSVLVIVGLCAVSVAGMALAEAAGGSAMDVMSNVMVGLFGLFFLGSLIPNFAVQVRRFHDQDKSGWMILLGLIPYAGWLILLVFMCMEGTRGANRFGPDPKHYQPDHLV